MPTGNLNIDYITTAQTAKETTANAAFDILDEASNDEYGVAMSDADFDLATDLHADGESNAIRYFTFDCTGTLTQERNVTVPTNKRVYSFENNTTGGYPITVKTAAGTGIEIPNGGKRLLRCDGTNVVTVDNVDPAQPAYSWSYNRRTIGNDTSSPADTDHDIIFFSGQTPRDSTDTVNLPVSSNIKKRIDATFAEGDGNGGLFDDGSSPAPTVANTTWYHCFVIGKTDGTIDAYFDTSITAANIPSAFTYYAYVGSILTDGSANIRQFRQERNLFKFIGSLSEDINNVDTSSPPSQDLSATVTIPPGVRSEVRLSCWLTVSGTGSIAFKHPDDTTLTSITDPAASPPNQHTDLSLTTSGHGVVDGIISDTSQTIYWVTDATSTILDATVLQYRNMAIPA